MVRLRRQLVWDFGDLDRDVVAEVETEFEEVLKRVLARADRRTPHDAAVGGWTAALGLELVNRLIKRGRSVQASTLAYEAHHEGFAPRAVVYALGGYPFERRLNGFTRPTNAIVREMIDEGLLPADAINPMEPRYDPARLSFQQAQGFALGSDPEVAMKLAAVFAQVLPEPDVAEDTAVQDGA